MGVVLILLCTLIGYLVGSAGIGLIVGLVIVLGPWAFDEWDESQRRKRARRRYQGRKR